MEDAQDSEALLAYGMNGEPLPIQHGHPLRLIVPRWYAVTSVKWLTEIADEEVAHGDLAVRGVAWSGAAPIVRVEVSVGDGAWQQARLVGERNRGSWQWWELIIGVDGPGSTTVRARATDLAGRTQPLEPEWNRLGYGNNSVQVVSVRVR